MASSDDEEEVGPKSVSSYYFEDDKEVKLSFDVLPIQWSGDESVNGHKKRIYLRGNADNGLQTVHKHVVAWKFDLTNVTPEISVLSKEKSWIKLIKPRKAYEEEFIRTILITVHCLSYAKRNPEATGKVLWNHLSKVFSSYEVRPSQNDLVDHVDLISEALKRDDSLAKSKFLCTFLEERPKKRKRPDEDVKDVVKSGFIVDDAEDVMTEDPKEESDEDEDLFDSVCAFCDNGGELLCCEGRCMRSFHPTENDGDPWCPTLSFTKEEVEAMPNFLCMNCEHRQHQCFACGTLGSSDKASGAEVFPCISATCGRFYHPHCVSKLLFRDDKVAAEQLCKSISSGKSFTCPLHKCYVCKDGEDKTCHDLQFAVCRRCPKAYHRKCLPEEITFARDESEGEEEEDEEEDEEVPKPRAWDNLLLNRRILIYCLDHEIDETFGTPMRNHIIFPGGGKNNTVVETSKKQKLELPSGKEKLLSKKGSLSTKDLSQEKSVSKAPKRSLSAIERGETIRKNERLMAGSSFARKVKESVTPRKPFKANAKSVAVEVDGSSTADAKKTSLGDRLYAYVTQGTEETKPGKRDTNLELNKSDKSTRKKLSSDLPELDADSQRRLLSLVKDASSSITLDHVVKKHKVPSTHVSSSKYVVDRGITMGKLEGAVEAIRTALKKLEEENGSIADAKAVCEPEILGQMYRWKNKLRVYLAPFLHGMRYTSFGRHFTKVDKLQEIVNKLHLYVQDGDMIVDFCCGANDFSCLMKKKLEETGKKCLYKNYDIIQPKNDFSFEKRDFMTVKPEELAPGSQLIMGLNPPFGVKASLANTFINKALEFNPKLLILIVPPETERLDKKKSPYDLIWEDNQFLSGKSFYLPGSVDDNDKQLDQWNLTAPLLYLWSHRDWTDKHKSIAENQGHIVRQQEESHSEINGDKTRVLDREMEEDDHYGDTSMLTDPPLHTSEASESRHVATTEGCQGSSRDTGSKREGQDSHGSEKNNSNTSSKKRLRDDKGKKASGSGKREKSVSDKKSSGNNSESEIFKGITVDSPSNLIAGKSSLQQLGTAFDGSQAYSSSAYGFSGGATTEEPLAIHTRGGSDGLGYRGYIGDVPRESDVRSQVRYYGQNQVASTPGYGRVGSTAGYDLVGSTAGYGQVGSLSSTPYGNLGLSSETSYRTSLSAMDRYAPRLDEMNRRMVGGSSALRPGYLVNPTSFVSAPQPPFPHHNSAGWLDE